MKCQALSLSVFLAGASIVTARNPEELKKHKDAIFTPKDMLALPRPAPVVASPNGHLGLSAVSQHSFETRKTTTSLHLIQLNETSGPRPQLLLESVPGQVTYTDSLWLSDTVFAYVNRTGTGAQLWYRGIEGQHHKDDAFSLSEARHLLTLPPATGPASLKFLSASPSNTSVPSGVLAFSAHVWKGYEIEDTERLEKEYANRGDDAMIWDETYIREWDTWRNPDKVHQIFLISVTVPEAKTSVTAKPRKPVFISPFNASGIWSLMQPFETGDYDLTWDSSHPGHRLNIAVQIKDKYLNYAFNSRRQIYLTSLAVDRRNEVLQLDSAAADVQMITPGDQGDVSSLAFSPNGTVLSWLQREENGAESDRNRIMTYDLESKTRTVWTEKWDRSPNVIAWAKDGQSVYLLAEDAGFTLPYHLTHPGHLPTPLLFNGTTSGITHLGGSRLLLDISTLTHPTESFVLDLNAPRHDDGDKVPLSRLSPLTNWSAHGLSHASLSKGEKFWFKGAHGHDVMGWLLLPRGFKRGSDKKWPLAFLIHGGPEGAWEDSWSTRWNPNVFAQQGYVVVAINPTGSTGYGQDFVTAIYENWGGSPFKDLVAGLQYVLEKHPEIDRERMAALGASYGGYMINWLQGHNEHTKFKAFVCHDGLFETHNMYYSTEQVYFPQRENGGLPPWQNRAPYEKWSPNNFVHEWSTPALIIHGGRDYRVPDTQGISAFTALQSRGIPSRFLYFKDENHWVLDPQNSLRWHHEVFRWLEEWVGNAEGINSKKTLRIQH